MNATDKPFEAYVYAIREQVEQHLAGLDELRVFIGQRPLTFNERNALARGLQVLVEAAIGCSKHLLKSRGKPVPSDARTGIERVYEILAITDPAIDTLRGAVGMRNAIIHDYLNLDWRRVEEVLLTGRYWQLEKYVSRVTDHLLEVC